MIEDERQRRRQIRYQLLNAIAALDGASEHDVGDWLYDLAEAMITGDPVPPLARLEAAAAASNDDAFLKSVESAGNDPPDGFPPLE
jgi:hypothetical protein